MDPAAIRTAAKKHETDMVRFLRDIIAIEGYSGGEKKVIERIRKEVKKLGAAEKIWVDGLGNLLVRAACLLHVHRYLKKRSLRIQDKVDQGP